jgi:prevent-host-death family protein
MRVEVGVRELRENLSDWLDRAAAGEEILVTERGKPKAVITAAESAWDRMGTGPRHLPPRVKWDGEGPTLTDYLMYNRGKIPWPGPGPEPGTEDAEA